MCVCVCVCGKDVHVRVCVCVCVVKMFMCVCVCGCVGLKCSLCCIDVVGGRAQKEPSPGKFLQVCVKYVCLFLLRGYYTELGVCT